MSYGIQFNMAVTSDDNQSTCGIHVTDSSGLDISREESGAKIKDVVSKAYDAVVSDVSVVAQARALQEEKKKAENRKRNNESLNAKRKSLVELRNKAEKLQKEIDEMQRQAENQSSAHDDDVIASIFSLSKEFNDIFKILL